MKTGWRLFSSLVKKLSPKLVIGTSFFKKNIKYKKSAYNKMVGLCSKD
jgi:hypothetical protein